MLFVTDWDSLEIASCSIKGFWNIPARKRCCLSHNSLLDQRLLKYQRWINVWQSESCTSLDWEVLGNHPVHLPPQSGMTRMTKFKRPSFTIQAYHMKINHVRPPWLSIASGSTGGHLLWCQADIAVMQMILSPPSGLSWVSSLNKKIRNIIQKSSRFRFNIYFNILQNTSSPRSKKITPPSPCFRFLQPISNSCSVLNPCTQKRP